MGNSWFTRQVRRATKQRRTPSARPRMEVLEDRIALATRIWDGNSLSNNWSNAFNWDHDIAPSHGDDLVFPAGIFNDNKVADNDYSGTFNARSITFLGSGFTVRGNPINLGVGGIVDTSGSSNRISNDVNLTGSLTFNIGSGSTLFMDGEITGGSASTITKTGAGDLSFEDQNSYFGPTVVNQGRLYGKKDTSLGLGGAGTTVNSGATLLIIDTVLGAMHVAEALTISEEGHLRVINNVDLEGAMVFNRAATFNAEGPVKVLQPVTFVRDNTVTTSDKLEFLNNITLSDGTLTLDEDILPIGVPRIIISGPITGVGGLKVVLGDILSDVLLNGSSSNTYQGGTFVGGGGRLALAKSSGATAIPPGLLNISLGHVELRNPQQISSLADVIVANDFDLNGNDNTIASLTIEAHAIVKTSGVLRTGVLSVTGSIIGTNLLDARTFGNFTLPAPEIKGELYLGSGIKSLRIDDHTLLISAKLTGTGTGAGISKTGAGTLVFTGNNTYSGNTSVSEGNLRIHGNQPDSRAVVHGGRLLGTGTIGGLSVFADGRVKPGSIGGFGTLRVAGDVIFLAGSILEVSLNNPIAGLGYDQIIVQGPGTSGLGSGIVHFNGAIVQPFVGLGNAIGDTFRIIDNDDSDVPTNETFASNTQISVPQGGVLVAPGGERFTVNYRGSVGNNDVVLTRTTAGALFPNRSVTPQIIEGGVVTLTGIVSDPDRKDTFFLRINWGDGSPVETKVFGPTFNSKQVFIRHRYLTSQVDPYVIQLNWHDQRGAGNSGTLTTLVTASAQATKATDGVFASLLSLREKKSLNLLGN